MLLPWMAEYARLKQGKKWEIRTIALSARTDRLVAFFAKGTGSFYGIGPEILHLYLGCPFYSFNRRR
jgi:hypothetical protein